MLRHCLFLLAATALIACDYDNGTAKALERSEKIETFADPQIKAYHQAKEVQGIVDEAALQREAATQE